MKRCPVLDYAIVGGMRPGSPGSARATGPDGTVGTLKFSVSQEFVTVQLAEVDTPGCGIGTKLYTKVAQAACERGLRVRSDTNRTDASEGFWAKQARKGRALCSGKGGTRIRKNARGKYVAAGSWPCLRYELKRCPVRSLSGRR